MRIVLLLLLISFLAACGAPDGPPPPPVEPRDVVLGAEPSDYLPVDYPAPSLRATTLDGRMLDLDALRDTVVLVNFWATWCGPCLREIPDLVALRTELDDAPFEIVGVAFSDPDTAAVTAFVQERDLPYPTILDGEGRWADGLGGVFVMPSSFIVDASGTVVRRVTGLADPDSLRAIVLPLLPGSG